MSSFCKETALQISFLRHTACLKLNDTFTTYRPTMRSSFRVVPGQAMDAQGEGWRGGGGGAGAGRRRRSRSGGGGGAGGGGIPPFILISLSIGMTTPSVTDERPSLAHCMNADRRKLKYSDKNLPQCHFIHHKSHTNWPGIEPGCLR